MIHVKQTEVNRAGSLTLAPPPPADDVGGPITSSIASTMDGVKLVIPRSASTSINDGVKLLLKLGDDDDDEEAEGALVVVIEASTPTEVVEIGVGATVVLPSGELVGL